MSWRDRIDPELKGSFRGVAFCLERSDTKGGRRWLVHEYPRRDKPYTEDMGKAAREWRLQFFVAGDDYDRWRDRMVEALDAPGPATLVHPYLGTFRAVATDTRWRESTSDGGVCTFQVTFVESGEETFPSSSVDTRREVRQAAEAFEGALTSDFEDKWSVEGLTGWSLVAVERDLAAVVRDLDQAVGGVADEVAAEIRAPVNIATAVIRGYNRIKNAVVRPARAADLYSGSQLGGGDDSEDRRVMLPPGTPRRASRMLRETGVSGQSVEPPEATTPERIQRAQNTVAAQRLNGRAAALAASRLMAETDWASRQDAEAAGTDCLALIDAEMATENVISDSVYASLVKLRAAVSEDLRTRATALPGLIDYTPQATLPALVVAHTLYGDARRADEITVRNNLPHPGALRGGMTLEVLSE